MAAETSDRLPTADELRLAQRLEGIFCRVCPTPLRGRDPNATVPPAAIGDVAPEVSGLPRQLFRNKTYCRMRAQSQNVSIQLQSTHADKLGTLLPDSFFESQIS
jgi:hypothetical protein